MAGGGQDLLVRIPAGVAHGYRPLTNPCALLYFVTETFDPAAPRRVPHPLGPPGGQGPLGGPEQLRSENPPDSRLNGLMLKTDTAHR